jgi:hypothetical protein
MRDHYYYWRYRILPNVRKRDLRKLENLRFPWIRKRATFFEIALSLNKNSIDLPTCLSKNNSLPRLLDHLWFEYSSSIQSNPTPQQLPERQLHHRNPQPQQLVCLDIVVAFIVIIQNNDLVCSASVSEDRISTSKINPPRVWISWSSKISALTPQSPGGLTSSISFRIVPGVECPRLVTNVPWGLLSDTMGVSPTLTKTRWTERRNLSLSRDLSRYALDSFKNGRGRRIKDGRLK